MLQNPCKTLGFKKNMVYKIPPGGEVNHIQPVAYNARSLIFSSWLFGCYALRRFISLDEHGGSKASQGKSIFTNIRTPESLINV